MEWLEKFNQEIDHAETARASGNEGLARVRARRAAGIVIGEWLERNGQSSFGPSAYDRIRRLAELTDVPDDVSETANHFLLKVDLHYSLPNNIDLIHDARQLAVMLFDSS
jgi:hypothetical protein